MLDELEPKVVLVYGAMPDTIFHGLETITEFEIWVWKVVFVVFSITMKAK